MHQLLTPETAPALLRLLLTANPTDSLAALLDRLSDPERLAEVGDWTIECETEAELLGRVQDALP